jgi:hypothetical protein
LHTTTQHHATHTAHAHTPSHTHRRYQKLRKKAGLVVTDSVALYYEEAAAAAAAAAQQRQQQQAGDAAGGSGGGGSLLARLLAGQAAYLQEALGHAPAPLAGKPADHVVIAQEVVAVGDVGDAGDEAEAGAGADSGAAFTAIIAAPPGSSALRLVGASDGGAGAAALAGMSLS